MTSQPQPAVPKARNAACPCGSGKKFKHCCMGKSSANRGAGGNRLWWQGSITLVLVAGVIALVAVNTGGGEGAATPASSAQPAFGQTQPTVLSSGLTPEPWFFNTATNQHWHAGHGHWHDGPPPPLDQRGDASPLTPLSLPTSLSGQSSSLPLPSDQLASTPASGQPDAYGRQPGDPHYGHDHP
ncbi:MAG: SEC-C domain-containing protein [Phycisphaerales bacterium]|nr:SEC-C domain-containing protein [Phycisphaerales bacterium]MCI0629514.1 SEC-C domain-containing protein [Phycisphaerales bacterium]